MRRFGGPRTWAGDLTTRVVAGSEAGPFAAVVLTPPELNPWACQFRLSGLDFFDGGRRAAVCSWDGDVWLVDGLGGGPGVLTWRRIASGLFQPLGLKVVEGTIHVACRDQITILRDLNGDGETDFYECFNTDHQVTEHFHEFAMGLQTNGTSLRRNLMAKNRLRINGDVGPLPASGVVAAERAEKCQALVASGDKARHFLIANILCTMA